jgi:hypothetical protein
LLLCRASVSIALNSSANVSVTLTNISTTLKVPPSYVTSMVTLNNGTLILFQYLPTSQAGVGNGTGVSFQNASASGHAGLSDGDIAGRLFGSGSGWAAWATSVVVRRAPGTPPCCLLELKCGAPQ